MSEMLRPLTAPRQLANIQRCRLLANIQRCRLLSVTAAPPQGWRLIWQRLTQSFRLMVGVQDYQNYLHHMQQQHPLTTPMSEKAFHRYCLEARFPAQAGKMGKCPC